MVFRNILLITIIILTGYNTKKESNNVDNLYEQKRIKFYFDKLLLEAKKI